LIFTLLLLAIIPALGIERFPPPDFSGGHQIPETVVPDSLARSQAWIDVAALTLGLLLASWISLRLRSRKGLVILSLVALAYFGFWRRGCVCAIGSVQNVALGLADPGYAVPLAVIAFFSLPLLTALIWGRSFCAGVCPHGAIQDLVLVRPLKVPHWLDQPLRLLPWIYLTLAVLLAATGGMFLICKYDPFVGIFRMGGPRTMLLVGGGLLVLSMFVGRPYCRWLCPYGALLGLLSRVSRFRPSVTPDHCSQCRLCENACPYGAIHLPTRTPTAPADDRDARLRTLSLLVLVPLAAVLFGWLGGKVGLVSVAWHPTGELAGQVAMADAGTLPEPAPDEITAWRQSGADRTSLNTAVAVLEERSLTLGRILGAIFGVAAALHLIRVAFPRPTADYETDAADCVSCARCFSSCPYERQRLGLPTDIPGGSHV
jgi:ferredoxin